MAGEISPTFTQGSEAVSNRFSLPAWISHMFRPQTTSSIVYEPPDDSTTTSEISSAPSPTATLTSPKDSQAARVECSSSVQTTIGLGLDGIRLIDFTQRRKLANQQINRLKYEQRKIEEQVKLYDLLEKSIRARDSTWAKIKSLSEDIPQLEEKRASALAEIALLEIELGKCRSLEDVYKLMVSDNSNAPDISFCTFPEFVRNFDTNNMDKMQLKVELMERNVKLCSEYMEQQEKTKVINQKKQEDVVQVDRQLDKMNTEIIQGKKELRDLENEIFSELQKCEEKYGGLWTGVHSLDKVSEDPTALQVGGKEIFLHLISETQLEREKEKYFEEARHSAMVSSKEELNKKAKEWYQKGWTNAKIRWKPLIQAGAQIRGRVLEYKRVARWDQEIVERGHQAAHHGMALADALLYGDGLEKQYRRHDSATFERLYMMKPQWVLDRKSVPKIIEILDWNCGITSFRGTKATSIAAFSDTFTKFWTKVKALRNENDLIALQKLIDENEKLYQELKKIYDEQYECNRQWHMRN